MQREVRRERRTERTASEEHPEAEQSRITQRVCRRSARLEGLAAQGRIERVGCIVGERLAHGAAVWHALLASAVPPLAAIYCVNSTW